MIDGLGLVYEKQGNTGAAAYNNPVLEIGGNPLDALALQIKDQRTQLEKDSAEKAKAKEKANQEALDFDFPAWDIDQKRIFAQKTVDLKKKGAELAMKGKNLDDYTDDEVVAWRTELESNKAAAGSSKSQEAEYKKIKDFTYLNPQKYDYEKTMTAMNAWLDMDPTARMSINPKDLIVEKYDIFAPFKALKPSEFMPSTTSENETSATSVKKFDRKKAETAVQAIIDNPANKMYFDYGINNGAFGSKEEYKKMAVDLLESRAPKEVSVEIKPPKAPDWDDTYINNSNTDELLSKIGIGKMNVAVPYYTGPDGKIVTTNINYTTTVQLGNIDATVAAQSLIDAETGETIGGTGVKDIKSGAMLLTPVYKGTYKPYPLQPEQNQQDLIDTDIIEYKPLTLTNIENPDPMDITATEKKSVWVNAKTVINGTPDGDAKKYGQVALKVLEKKANELNKKSKKKAPGK